MPNSQTSEVYNIMDFERANVVAYDLDTWEQNRAKWDRRFLDLAKTEGMNMPGMSIAHVPNGAKVR
jgi:hypothetical protein